MFNLVAEIFLKRKHGSRSKSEQERGYKDKLRRKDQLCLCLKTKVKGNKESMQGQLVLTIKYYVFLKGISYML